MGGATSPVSLCCTGRCHTTCVAVLYREVPHHLCRCVVLGGATPPVSLCYWRHNSRVVACVTTATPLCRCV
ncbi:hypothetical protein Y032_0679g1462 [Ancylostoma ceylanicum]|uniref:Uncharacterized protein n=1 Tax=Ancylostoma ceylanicum TaxID=53326 RepID=A0A016WII9_9BILA|nr:hypothetical protein Y032_0679g1462 [Ancylostoma ceylanicum]